jgi:DNA-binding CsgD family transcriptional regulator
MGCVKGIRKLFESDEKVVNKKPHGVKPRYYVFCDKKTGSALFRVEADAKGELPLDRAAGLLAIHCLGHRCSPSDLLLVFGAEEDLVQDVAQRAGALLEAAGVGACPVTLSRREQEVLRAVSDNLANKEIATLLCVSERTVKFHVSSLLAKFGVKTRTQLSHYSAVRLSVPGVSGPNLDARAAVRTEPSQLPLKRAVEPMRAHKAPPRAVAVIN